jgi:Bacteriophage probable baseplate hub protein
MTATDRAKDSDMIDEICKRHYGDEDRVGQVFEAKTADGRGTYGRAVAQWSELGNATVHNVKTGDTDPVLSLRHRYANKTEALRAAYSALARSKRASGTISVRLAGFHPDLLAEGKVDLQGIHPDLTGEWLVTRVTHPLSGTLTTSFEAERNNSTESSCTTQLRAE